MNMYMKKRVELSVLRSKNISEESNGFPFRRLFFKNAVFNNLLGAGLGLRAGKCAKKLNQPFLFRGTQLSLMQSIKQNNSSLFCYTVCYAEKCEDFVFKNHISSLHANFFCE